MNAAVLESPSVMTAPLPGAGEIVDLFCSDPNDSGSNPGGVVESGAMVGCVHMDIPASEYHQLPDSISCSGLKHVLRSPAHYQAYLEEEDDGKPNIGTALHCAVLEPDVFENTYLYYDGERRGKAYTAFEERHQGKVILNAKEWIKVLGMRQAVMDFDEFPLWAALQQSRREMSIFWTDEETGVNCRVRLDACLPSFLNFDLKTTTDCRPDAFMPQAVRLDYDLQAAMYSEGTRRFFGKALPFTFVAIEEDRPHGIWLHEASEQMIENGWKKFRRALSRYAECKATGQWPKYQNAHSILTLPRYALFQA